MNIKKSTEKEWRDWVSPRGMEIIEAAMKRLEASKPARKPKPKPEPKQMELKFKRTQRHLAWVCVGTNEGATQPTWFYVFRTSEKADSFVDQAKGVAWEVYPCELEEPRDALRNFEKCSKEIEEAFVFNPNNQPKGETK